MPDLLVITASQRAGTTSLGWGLHETGLFHSFNEIFHTVPKAPGAFIEWARERELKWHDVQTLEGATAIADAYIAFLKQKAGERIPLIDIKFNSWTTLTHAWAYPGAVPFFLEYMCGRTPAVIFVRRHDLTAQIISEEIAREVRKWHELEMSDISDLMFSVHPHTAGERARNIIRSETLILRQLWDRKVPVLCVTYENLFERGAATSLINAFLQKQFALTDVPQIIPSHTQNTGDKRALVSNYAEIEAVVHQVAITEARWPLS
jgi:LPS sulfotransferase NodH